MSRVWATILLAGAGTFTMRLSFLAVAHRLAAVPEGSSGCCARSRRPPSPPSWCPPCCDPKARSTSPNPRLAAGLLAAAVAWRTRNTALTLVVGMAVLLTLEAL